MTRLKPQIDSSCGLVQSEDEFSDRLKEWWDSSLYAVTNTGENHDQTSRDVEITEPRVFLGCMAYCRLKANYSTPENKTCRQLNTFRCVPELIRHRFVSINHVTF